MTAYGRLIDLFWIRFPQFCQLLLINRWKQFKETIPLVQGFFLININATNIRHRRSSARVCCIQAWYWFRPPQTHGQILGKKLLLFPVWAAPMNKTQKHPSPGDSSPVWWWRRKTRVRNGWNNTHTRWKSQMHKKCARPASAAAKNKLSPVSFVNWLQFISCRAEFVLVEQGCWAVKI